MATFLQIKSQIADEMDATDLLAGGQISKAIKAAIRVRENNRYWFNETRSFTFDTVVGVDTYTLTDALVTEFIAIDEMELLVGTQYECLSRDWTWEMASAARQGTTGRPWAWAFYGNTVQLYPSPNDIYTLRVHGHYSVSELIDDDDENIWTNHAFDMIREDAKAILYAGVRRNVEDAQLSVGLAKGYSDALISRTSKMRGTSRLKAWS